MRTPVLIPLVFIFFVASGCRNGTGFSCTSDFKYGLNITVTDATTGSPPDQATLIATSGAYIDSVGPVKPFQAVFNGPLVLVLSTAGERPGVYSALVRSPGYHDWMRSGIEVTADQCHVRPVNIIAGLQRL